MAERLGSRQSVTHYMDNQLMSLYTLIHAEDTTLTWGRAVACAARQRLNVESEDLYREGRCYANVPSEPS